MYRKCFCVIGAAFKFLKPLKKTCAMHHLMSCVQITRNHENKETRLNVECISEVSRGLSYQTVFIHLISYHKNRELVNLSKAMIQKIQIL